MPNVVTCHVGWAMPQCHWMPLDAIGCQCILLDAVGCCWMLLDVVGGCWRLLDAVGCCWVLLDVVGCQTWVHHSGGKGCVLWPVVKGDAPVEL